MVVFVSTVKEQTPSSMSGSRLTPGTRTLLRLLWTYVVHLVSQHIDCCHRCVFIGSFSFVLQLFANETLRTLCLCYKDISTEDYNAWARKHKEAQVTLVDRDAALDRVYEEIENNLMVSGEEVKCN